jgi:hypothetical protein
MRLSPVLCCALLLLLPACVAQQAAPNATQYATTPVPADSTDTFLFTPTPESAGYPVPITDTAAMPYPLPEVTDDASVDGRSLLAMEAYEIAAPVAQANYAPDAQLFVVIPSSIMMRNLGNPPVEPGWFFKFKRDAQAHREFIVQVVDGRITGSLEAEAAVLIQPLELPIDLEQVNISSDDVFERFAAVAQERGINTQGVIFDLELVQTEVSDGPVWSVVHPDTLEWLYSISATTGEEVANPRQSGS